MGSLIGLVATDLDTWTGLAVSNGLAMPVLAPAEGVAVESGLGIAAPVVSHSRSR